MTTLAVLGGIYVGGVVISAGIMYTVFYNSSLIEVIVPALAWPVVLPILIIGLSV